MAHSGGEGILISEPGSDILEAYRYNYGHGAPDRGNQISSKFFNAIIFQELFLELSIL